MAEARVYNMKGEEVGTVDLPEEIFGMGVSTHVLWEAVRAEELNARRGTADTQNRRDVSFTGTKPWRQKHTGHARAGSYRSPIWVGGAVAHGPHPRQWSLKINRKVRRKAVAGILSERLAEGNLRLIRDLSCSGRTREIAEMIRNQGYDGRKTVILVSENDETTLRAARNIPWATATSARSVSLRTLVGSEVVLLSENAVDLLKERVL
jgi:large subunit ribosomal protein L4